MTSVAALLVQESKMNGEIAFRLFLALTEKYRLDDVYGPDMKDVNLRYFQLDEALRLHLPRLHAHLSDRDIHPSTYASWWALRSYANYLFAVVTNLVPMLQLDPDVVHRVPAVPPPLCHCVPGFVL